jgi:hypothetical protein
MSISFVVETRRRSGCDGRWWTHMKIQPRQQLLEIWRATARSTLLTGRWTWGGRHQRNSISDAEHLLCLLGPATEIPTFRLDLPNETAEDVLDALDVMGDSIEIPQVLIKVLTDYYVTYTDDDKTPVFSGGSYFTLTTDDEMPEKQQALHVVDSFAASVRLSLATIGFVKVLRGVIRRRELLDEISLLEAMASKRLTASMVGLLRSFAVHVFDLNSQFGNNLLRTVNQARLPPRHILEDLHRELREIKAGLRDITVGSGQVTDIDNDNKLFECGWSWGIVQDAPQVLTTAEIGEQREGLALAAPYLYFTVVALDCIRNLFSERTRLLGLLDDEQQRLARALQLRWDLTQSYWSKIARYGKGRWPLEDIPWRTVDGVESDYLSLLVCSIVVQELSNRRAPESESQRVGKVLNELAGRARLTRREMAGDPAIALHVPGFSLDLEGSENVGSARLRWLLADFSPQLLKQAIRVAEMLRHNELRGEVTALADQIWEHLLGRRLQDGPAEQLWDKHTASNAAGEETTTSSPSWYYTERVVECLVIAAEFVSSPPLTSPELTDVATDLLAEADHIFDQELLSVSAEAGPAMGTALHAARATLRRAHEIMPERPGTAAVLAWEVLRELDRLAAARQRAVGAG